MEDSKPKLSLRHIAIKCANLEKCLEFYTNLGFKIDFHPDPDHIFLSSGDDNLALHRAQPGFNAIKDHQYLDHFGFMVSTPEQVTEWYEYLRKKNVEMLDEPSAHRDGTFSFYCYDPDRHVVQFTYHPRLKF
jgi:catechol 2,3-dioxygenase-like lactoylglutathione lyase family enzyme